jgi:hypothetical protein
MGSVPQKKPCINGLLAQIKAAQQTNSEFHEVYIDFAKAFDSVPYWAIEHTMKAMKAKNARTVW